MPLNPTNSDQAKDSAYSVDRSREPRLGISRRAVGRERSGNRVLYCVEPDGTGSRKAVAESVLLQRWRHRDSQTHIYSGSRLAPYAWSAVSKAFPAPISTWFESTEAVIRDRILAFRNENPVEARSMPNPSILKALLEVCGSDRLKAILARHTDSSRHDRFGTPDLFLYSRNRRSERIASAQFIEVKKPEEAVSDDQREEIEFLQSLGLRAGVVRLIEPKSAAK